jgi:hypothetical protein
MELFSREPDSRAAPKQRGDERNERTSTRGGDESSWLQQRWSRMTSGGPAGALYREVGDAGGLVDSVQTRRYRRHSTLLREVLASSVEGVGAGRPAHGFDPPLGPGLRSHC